MPTRPIRLAGGPKQPPLRSRLREGAILGAVLAVYLFLGEFVIAMLKGETLPIAHLAAIPRGLAYVGGFTLGGALLQGLKPVVGSVWESMLLFMLCSVPTLLGVGLMVFGWQLAALLPLVMTFPLGTALGFGDWNNLYRHARPRKIPP